MTLSDGVSLRVAESGDGRAPVVLLVHGWGASIYMWRDWFAPLAAAGSARRRGRPSGPRCVGQADRSGPIHAGVARRRRARADRAARDSSAPDIVAQSMGGTIALELARRAARRRVGRLVARESRRASGRCSALPPRATREPARGGAGARRDSCRAGWWRADIGWCTAIRRCITAAGHRSVLGAVAVPRLRARDAPARARVHVGATVGAR